MSYLAYQSSYSRDFAEAPLTPTERAHSAGVATVFRGDGKGMPSDVAELETYYDHHRRIFWQFMMPKGRPSFTPGLLRDMTLALDTVELMFEDRTVSARLPAEFLVLASRLPGIFNLGGDLPHFIELIERGDHERLRWYARICAKGQYRRAIGLDLPLCTIALVQGDALGGGFEAALAHDFIIAERSASFGLPEVLFNLFPGMGAYSFLSRRLGAAAAERLILGGKVHTAEELYTMGVVDRLAEDGEGLDAVNDFIREFMKAAPARRALLRARRLVNPITLRELIEIADLWADAAMQLKPADLRKMRHLARAQDRRCAKTA